MTKKVIKRKIKRTIKPKRKILRKGSPKPKRIKVRSRDLHDTLILYCSRKHSDETVLRYTELHGHEVSSSELTDFKVEHREEIETTHDKWQERLLAQEEQAFKNGLGEFYEDYKREKDMAKKVKEEKKEAKKVAKKAAKAEKKVAPKKATETKKSGSARKKFLGFGTTSAIRRMKQLGMPVDAIAKAMSAEGVECKETTLRSVSGNTKPETAAKFSAEQEKTLLKKYGGGEEKKEAPAKKDEAPKEAAEKKVVKKTTKKKVVKGKKKGA